MATTFENDLSGFGDYPTYVKSLRKALGKVKQDAQPPMEFLYFKAYRFADAKERPLVIVDYNDKFRAALKREKQLTATAEGTVSLTAGQELDFAPTRGSVKRAMLKTLLNTMGGMPAVHLGDEELPEGDAATGGPQGGQPQATDASLAARPGSPKALPKVPVRPQATGTGQGTANGASGANGAGNGLPKPSPQETPPRSQPKPLPAIPQDLLRRVTELKNTQLDVQGEAKKEEALKSALSLAQKGEVVAAGRLLDALAARQGTTPKPLPKPPQRQGTGPQERDEPDDAAFDADDTREALVLDSPTSKKAALPPSASVATAQQRLAAEEAAFARRKTITKSEKIKASYSQQEALKKQEEEKAEKKARKAAEKEANPDKGLLDRLSFGKKSGDKPAVQEQREKNRIEVALANKKADDEIKKYTGKPLAALGLLGQAETAAAKGFDKVLAADNKGDDIASAAGVVATSLAGVTSSLVEAGRAYVLYRKTHGAEKTVHLKVAMTALGGAFANLVNLTKGSITIADHSGAIEAGSAVPILGIVAAVPSLLTEINDLRSAITRLAKQQKVYAALEKQIEAGDASQTTLFATVSSFVSRDAERVAKGIARVTFDFTKIAGHGVTAGGVTGPAGVALVSVAAAGKLAISGVEGVQGLIAANKANDRRKKLEPTLNAAADWKKLPKSNADAPEMTGLTQALDGLGTVQKGSKEHAQALELVVACAEKLKQARAGSKDIEKFAARLVENATAEKLAWQDGAGDDDEEEPPQASAAEDPLQRNARKLIKQDPQVAAQVLVDQALREGAPGGLAFKVLESFGIKGSQLYGDAQGDDQIANLREIRQKVLFKLGAEDESAKTMTQQLRGAKEGVVNYLSMGVKHEELDKYLQAKDKLNHGNNSRRKEHKTLWKLKMDILTDDVEEKKEALRTQVEHLLEKKDIDPVLAAEVIELLRPRHETA